MKRHVLYMIRSTITVPIQVIHNTRSSISTVTRSPAWRILVTGRYSSATSIKILLFDSMECIVNLSNTIKNLIELLSPFSYNRCMMIAHTDISQVQMTPETVKLKMEIEDYLTLATSVSIGYLIRFNEMIQSIEDDESRIILETWYHNQPAISKYMCA